MTSPNGDLAAYASGFTDSVSTGPAAASEPSQDTADSASPPGGPAPSGLAEPGTTQSDGQQATTGEPTQVAEDAAALSPEELADQQDLNQYPESVRARFKLLERAERKALYEHAETNARQAIETAQAQTAELQKAEAERTAQRDAVLAELNEFSGRTAIQLDDGRGGFFAGPTYDDMVQAQQTQAGRDGLYQQYGLDEPAVEAKLAELDRNARVIGKAVAYLKDETWNDLAKGLRAGLAAVEGVNPDAMVAGVAGIHEVIARLDAHLTGKFTRQISEMKSNYEDRIGALTANSEGLKGRALAGSARNLPTGGRTGAADGVLTLDRYKAMSSEERGRLTSAERDEMMARHMADRGNGRR